MNEYNYVSIRIKSCFPFVVSVIIHVKTTTTLSLENSRQYNISFYLFHETPKIEVYMLHPTSCFCCFENRKKGLLCFPRCR